MRINKFIKSPKIISLFVIVLFVGVAFICFADQQLKKRHEEIDVMSKVTQEAIRAVISDMPLVVDMENNMLQAELNDKKDYVLAHDAYVDVIENLNKCSWPAPLSLVAVYQRKGRFETEHRKWSEAEIDWRKALALSPTRNLNLGTRLWLCYVLDQQNKNSEVLALARENLPLAEKLTKEGGCERIRLIMCLAVLARQLDLANRHTEASPLWKRHLELIKAEFGSTSSGYLQCSKALASHELVR